jgi:hypothetical protein
MEEEGGSSGKIVIDNYARRVLSGYNFRSERSTGDKATRAQPLAAAAERGLVKLVTAHWNKAFLDEVELFPYGAHDDQVDACSLAYNKLATKKQFWMRLAGEGGGDSADQYEREIQKLIDAGCYRLPSGKGIQRPDGVVQVIDLQPDAPGWNNNRGFGRRFG